MIPKAYIQDLLLKANIVEIIGQEIALVRTKQNFYGYCPFHNKGHPEEVVTGSRSFSVSAVERFYHCFACGAHGSVLGFLMQHKGLSFPDAVAVVAKATGIDLPEDTVAADVARADVSKQVRITLEQALKYYQSELPGAKAPIALLKAAGISGATAKRFRIGYAPDNWGNLSPVFGDNYRERCGEAGLVVVKDDGQKVYDRLRNRIIFPTINGRGQVLSMAGLAVVARHSTPEYLRTSSQAKGTRKKPVVNTMGKRADDKASMFGLHESIAGMHAEGYAVLVQDCLHVLRLHEAGMRNAVAPSVAGKLVTDNMARLFRSTSIVIACYPRTARGSHHAWGAMQIALPALSDEVQMRFALMPDGMNAGDVLNQPDGIALFRLLLDAAIPLSEYFLQRLASRADFRSIEGRAKVLSEADRMLELVSAPNLKTQLADAVRQLVDHRLELLDSVDEHDQWLAEEIRTANTRLVIVSPWVTLAGIGRFDLCLNIARAVARGVRVDIYTDPEFNARLRQRSAVAEAAGISAERELELAGARLHYAPRIHSKIVAVDERALCIGSFNWLSAAKGGSYQRHEVSLVHRHGDVGARIDQLLSAMSARRDDAAKG
jgi:DNA primase